MPLKIKILNKELPLIDIQRPISESGEAVPYAIFETIEIGKRSDKNIHTLRLEENDIKQIVSLGKEIGKREGLWHENQRYIDF